MNPSLIRPATVEDLERIGEIYNQEIRSGTATWNYTAHSMAEFQNWFQHLQKHQFPLLVVEDQSSGKVVGYANYDQFRTIQGFYKTVEHSIFLHPDYTGQGLGKQLLLRLIDIAKNQGMHIMVAAIDSENTASIHLHQKLGFVQTGYMPQVGEKFSEWRDLVLMQLNLDQP